MTLLATEPFNFGHGHPVNPDFCQGVLNVFHFKGLDDCFNLLHATQKCSMSWTFWAAWNDVECLMGCRPALRPQFDLCPHYLIESIVVHGEAHILRHSLHDVVFRQNMTDYPHNPFLPADINQTLQNVSPKPMSVKLIADNNSELRFAEPAHFEEPANSDNFVFFGICSLTNCDQRDFPVVVV